MVEIGVIRRLSHELVAATRQVEAADPDAPAWEAEVRVRRLTLGISSIASLWHARGRPPTSAASDARNGQRRG
jgi:hypothetical protein